jgi:hypothetical protein
MSLSRYVDKLITNKIDGIDKSQQLQSIIHPEIHFRYNSINLLISRRGVGKTFAVIKEIIKLSQLEDKAGYTTFLYVSDKTNDATVNELIKLVKLKVRIVSYEEVLEVLNDLIDAKSAYEEILNKNLQYEVKKETKIDLFSTLDLSEWVEQTPHTIILLDDAINILKDNKYKKLKNLLFQNRQPRLTIFICAQDIFGIPPGIKRNCDTIWLFAGMTDKSMFGIMCAQLGLNGKDIWDDYSSLDYRDVLIVDYTPKGIQLKLVKNKSY